MKKITLALMLVGMTVVAQVKGNKEIITKEVSVKGLTDLQMNLYAKVSLDMNAKAIMTITADSNLVDLIDTEIVNGRLNLVQKEWIQASQDISIVIGVPALERLEVGVHETVILKNVNQEDLGLMALNGRIDVAGKVSILRLGAENGTINASNLKASKVYLNIWGKGKAVVNATDLLASELSADARLVVVNQPKSLKGDTTKALAKNQKVLNTDIRYINIKIKNNSWNRNHFAVKGPRQDGGNFGYGFPMMPGAVKKERWTVGTKIYKVNKLGIRKFLVEIKAEDEKQTVKLFE